MKIGFFEVRAGEEDYFKKSLPKHELFFSLDPLTETNATQYPGLEIITTHTTSHINQPLIDLFPDLKLIATRTTGFDHIDVKYANSKNIMVSNIPSYGENTVAEFTFGLILALSRKIPQGYQRVQKTKKFDTTDLTGFDLKGKTIGVLGTGKIGSQLIKMAKGFDMKILAYDAYPNQKLANELGFIYQSLEEVLANSNVISLHVPFLPSTHYLLNAQNIPHIKTGALLVNTARGAVIETKALVSALEEGKLSGAALDVLEEEESLSTVNPKTGTVEISQLNQKLMDMPQVIITPHQAFDSQEALERILETTVENINSLEAGLPKNLIKLQP